MLLQLLLFPVGVLSQCPQYKRVGGPYPSQEKCKGSPTPPVKDIRPGELCNRDCTKDNAEYICTFYFVLEQHFSDTPGRLADGHNRSVLVYNGQIPGPTIAGTTVIWVGRGQMVLRESL